MRTLYFEILDDVSQTGYVGEFTVERPDDTWQGEIPHAELIDLDFSAPDGNVINSIDVEISSAVTINPPTPAGATFHDSITLNLAITGSLVRRSVRYSFPRFAFSTPGVHDTDFASDPLTIDPIWPGLQLARVTVSA